MNAIPKPSSDNHASPLRESLSSPFKALALILLYLLFFANPAAAQEFTDIAGYWGEPYIKALVEHGIVAGFPDGSFKPNEQVTRAQFAAMVTRAFELEEEGSQSAASFSDVSNKYWGSKAIAAVSSAGLVSGFPDGTFHPEERITRAQALVILAKTLPQAEIIKAERIGKEALARYTDADAVPPWAVKAVEDAAANVIIVSYPDAAAIQPNTLATRGDLAAMTYQALAARGVLPRLTIGILLPLARPSQQVKIQAPKISALNLLSPQALKAGEHLRISLSGTPHCHAYFKVSKLGETIEMNEPTPGIYEGSLLIEPGQHVENANIHATLMSSDGEHAERVSDFTISIEGSGPVITNVSPAPDSLIANRAPLIKAVFKEPGGLNAQSIRLIVDGKDVTTMSNVGPNSIVFKPPLPFSGQKVNAVVTVADTAGNTTRQGWTFFLQPPARPYPMYWYRPTPRGYYYRPMTPSQEIRQGLQREINSIIK